MTNKHIFIDTSGFKALIDLSDDFHTLALKIWKQCESEQVRLCTSNFIIDETVTLLRSKTSKNSCFTFKSLIFESHNKVMLLRVSIQDEAEAWNWFNKDWSKLSFTDCVTFAQLKRLGIQHVFGFDHHFEQAGFTLEH